MGILKKYNWLFPVLLLVALGLGTIGFHQYFVQSGQPTTWLTDFYLSIQLFVLNSGGVGGKVPIILEIARFMAPAVTTGGILLAIWEPFQKNYMLFKIRHWKNHIVVCGLSKKAEFLIEDFLRQAEGKLNIVLIDPNNQHAGLSKLKKKGVLYLEGNATDEEALLKANLLQAKILLALTHDEKINIQIAQRATHLYQQFPKKILPGTILQAILHIDDFYTMNLFKEFHEKAISEEVKNQPAGSKMDYHVFSIFQMAAMYMVDHYSPDQFVSLREMEDPAAHILILGDSRTTEFLILEAAHMFHFANLKKTKITVVSDDTTSLTQKMEVIYPSLPETVEIRYINTAHFFLEQCPIACDEISICFIALEDDGKSVYFARKLRQFIYAQRRLVSTTKQASSASPGIEDFRAPPIKVVLPRNTALVHIFSDIKTEFNQLDIELMHIDQQICNKKTIVDDRKSEDFIAEHMHYEWAKITAKKNNHSLSSMEEEWDNLKDARKDSNRLPARHLNIKLRFVQAEFTDQEDGEDWNIDNVDDATWERIARMEHNRWLAEKYLDGFMHIDAVPDKELMELLNLTLKCHPDIVPFDQLSKEIQAYDMFTFRMAPEIARLNNKRLVKKSAVSSRQ